MDAIELVRATPWAIIQPELDKIVGIAEAAATGTIDWEALVDRLAAKAQITVEKDEALDYRALATEMGRQLREASNATVRDGVATIPIDGPIFRRANLMTMMSGATSLEGLALDFNTALKSPDISAILLEVDSGGGEVSGVNEFTNMIRAGRGHKPIVAYVGNLAGSAAYWIASAADEIVTDETASVGGLGVIGITRGKPKGGDEEEKARGKEYRFISNQTPKKLDDPDTKEGRSAIQEHVDKLATIMLTSIAANRGIEYDDFLADFDGGSLMLAPDALKAGLADRLGSYESVHADLASRSDTATTHGRTPLRRAASAGDRRRFAAMARTYPLPLTAPVLAALTDPQSGGGFDPALLARLSYQNDGDEPQATTDVTEGVPMPKTDAVALAATLKEQGVDQATIDTLTAEITAANDRADAAEAVNAAQAAQSASLEARVTALTEDALTKRLTAEVMGTANDGQRWLGDPKLNVKALRTMITAHGEDSETTQAFIQQQRANANTFLDSDLTRGLGSDVDAVAGTATKKIEASAREIQKAAQARGEKLTWPQAMTQAMDDDPETTDEYSAEQAEVQEREAAQRHAAQRKAVARRPRR